MTDLPVPIIDSTNFNYGVQFKRDGKIYVIFLEYTGDGYQDDADSDKDAYQIQCAEIQWTGSKWQRTATIPKTKDGKILNVALGKAHLDIKYGGSVKTAFVEFLKLVNIFISEGTGGGVVDDGNFPETGTVTEQVEWLFTKLYMENDRLKMPAV